MNAQQVLEQLSESQRDAIRLIGSPDAQSDTINDRLIGELLDLKIFRKRGDGVLVFSELGDEVLQLIEQASDA